MIDIREFYSKDVEDVFVLCANINGEDVEYDDYVAKTCLSTIRCENGIFYLNPKWRQVLIELKLSPEYCAEIENISEDITARVYMDWDVIKDILLLEVEKNNKLYSNKARCLSFISSVIEGVNSDITTAFIEEMIEKSKTETTDEA